MAEKVSTYSHLDPVDFFAIITYFQPSIVVAPKAGKTCFSWLTAADIVPSNNSTFIGIVFFDRKISGRFWYQDFVLGLEYHI